MQMKKTNSSVLCEKKTAADSIASSDYLSQSPPKVPAGFRPFETVQRFSCQQNFSHAQVFFSNPKQR